MSEIDWSKAPEWATHHGFVGLRGHGVWLCDDRYAYVDGHQDARPFLFAKDQGYSREEISGESKRPTAWNGAGLPPVGTVCEVDYCGGWRRCEIIAHFQQRYGMVAAFTVGADGEVKSLEAFGEQSFRPILTQEQIAAEEREKALEAMFKIYRDAGEFRAGLAALYDAGLRFPEGGEA